MKFVLVAGDDIATECEVDCWMDAQGVDAVCWRGIVRHHYEDDTFMTASNATGLQLEEVGSVMEDIWLRWWSDAMLAEIDDEDGEVIERCWLRGIQR